MMIKRQVFILFLLILSTQASAQMIKLSDIEEMKEGTLIVGLTSNDTINEFFKNAISKYWTTKEVSEYLPVGDAMEKAKKDKSIYVMYLGTGSSASTTRHATSMNLNYKFISNGKRVKITNGKKGADPVLYTYFPTFGNKITEEALFYAMAVLEHSAQTMISDEIKSSLKWNSIFNKYNGELKSDTVYIAEGWLDDDFTEEDLKELYPAPIKVVSFEEWSEAILTDQPNVAYHIITPIPQAGDYTYVHYFMKSGEPKVLGTSYSVVNPKFKGGDMSVGSSISLGVIMKDINLSKSNIGYVNKKNASKFLKMLE